MTITDNTGRELTKVEMIESLKDENTRYELDYKMNDSLKLNIQMIKKMEAEILIEECETKQNTITSMAQFKSLDKQIVNAKKEINRVMKRNIYYV